MPFCRNPHFLQKAKAGKNTGILPALFYQSALHNFIVSTFFTFVLLPQHPFCHQVFDVTIGCVLRAMIYLVPLRRVEFSLEAIKQHIEHLTLAFFIGLCKLLRRLLVLFSAFLRRIRRNYAPWKRYSSCILAVRRVKSSFTNPSATSRAWLSNLSENSCKRSCAFIGLSS